ncbi:hypothetical protein [Caudoviricetes sp.]|nr:hypothetical protein [Caudoviricetes sp.]
MDENDKQAVERVSTLVVAALVFPRLASKYVADAEGFAAAARDSFDAAEAFAQEAKSRGYSVDAISALSEVI